MKKGAAKNSKGDKSEKGAKGDKRPKTGKSANKNLKKAVADGDGDLVPASPMTSTMNKRRSSKLKKICSMAKAASPSKQEHADRAEQGDHSQSRRKRKSKSNKDEPEEVRKTPRTSRKSSARSKKQQQQQIDTSKYQAEQMSIVGWIRDNNLDHKGDYSELKRAGRQAFGTFEYFALNPYWSRFTTGLTMKLEDGTKTDVAHFSFEKTQRGMLVAVACTHFTATQFCKLLLNPTNLTLS